MRIQWTLPIIAMGLLAACNNQRHKEETITYGPGEEITDATDSLTGKEAMLKAELAFSERSQTAGIRQALMEFIDSNGVLLRPNSTPLDGSKAIDFISQINDSAYTMVWETHGGHVANSGELGYTFGVFRITQKGPDSAHYGTYVNIWKKQPNGGWKLALDAGNDGIGE